ncbi:hypothetical protein I4U23_029969 [Adineta vaga]|nr:hypothetical protein I4U23_029969 [Adineta vaga]
MAHKNTKSGQKDTQIMSFEKESKSRDHLRLSVTPSDKLPESPAERYILSRSQMLNNSQDISPETPSPIASTTLKSLRSPMNHSEWMQNWHQQQTNNLYKKRKHGYVYGPPPASSSFIIGHALIFANVFDIIE